MAAKARLTPRGSRSVGGTRANGDTPGRDTVDALSDAWATVNPEFGSAELELSRRAARLYGILDEVLLARLAPLGLTRAEFLVVSGLRSIGAPYQLRPTDLTARLLLSSGGTSNVLNRLERAGLVERVRDDNDGRSTWVRLTDAGIEAAETAMTEWAQAHADVYRRVPPEVAESAADALRQVMLALGDEERPSAGGPVTPPRRPRRTRS